MSSPTEKLLAEARESMGEYRRMFGGTDIGQFLEKIDRLARIVECQREALKLIKAPDHYEPDYQTKYYCAVDKAVIGLTTADRIAAGSEDT